MLFFLALIHNMTGPPSHISALFQFLLVLSFLCGCGLYPFILRCLLPLISLFEQKRKGRITKTLTQKYSFTHWSLKWRIWSIIWLKIVSSLHYSYWNYRKRKWIRFFSLTRWLKYIHIMQHVSSCNNRKLNKFN